MTLRLTVDVAPKYMETLTPEERDEILDLVTTFVMGPLQDRLGVPLYKGLVDMGKHNSTDESNCEHCYKLAQDEIRD